MEPTPSCDAGMSSNFHGRRFDAGAGAPAMALSRASARVFLFAAVGILTLTRCNSMWTTSRDTKRTLRFAVESQGGGAAVSVNGYHCGQTPVHCRVEVTESKIWVHTRKEWKLYAGYVVGSIGLPLAISGVPLLALSSGLGKGWLGAGAAMTASGAVLTAVGIGFLVSFYLNVKKKYHGIHYNPKDIVVTAIRQGTFRQQVKFKTKDFVRRPADEPLRFRLGPSQP